MSLRDLPARPNLDQYRKQAKELLKGVRFGDATARDRMSRVHPRLSSPERIESATVTLADAQLVIAREHGINRALMRQELAFLAHLTRLIGHEPEAGYAQPGTGTAQPTAPALHRVLDLQA